MLGSKIKKLRKENGLTLKQLGELLNLGESTMSMYESGNRNPDYDTLTKLAKIFNCTTDYLLGRTDIKNSYEQKDIVKSKENHQNEIFNEIDSLSDESKKELEKYIQLLKIKDELDKGKDEQSSALEKNA